MARRNLVLSAGPDAILNRLDGVDCPAFSGGAVMGLQARCAPMPAASEEELLRWCRGIFEGAGGGSSGGGGSGGSSGGSSGTSGLYAPPLPKDEDDDEEDEIQ